MNRSKALIFLSHLLILTLSPLDAGKYYVLCEGNFGQANASLWSIDESLQTLEGPLIWNASSNALGDVAQSLTLFDHTLYIVMNGSHKIRVVDLQSRENHIADIDLHDASPRFMAVHRESGLGYVSSWNLGALLVVEMDSYAIVDTIIMGGLPEQILIRDDEMFVSVPMRSDWTAWNKVLRMDLSGNEPTVTHAYDVIDGPGAVVLIGDQLFVTSLYYNDAWETFSGTCRINLTDHTVVSLDHGLYTNFTADLNVIDGTPYRTYGSSLVPLNADLTLNHAGALGSVSGIYTHAAENNHIVVGSSDFVAPDLVTVLSLGGQELASFNVGALPSQVVYYSPDIVDTEPLSTVPAGFSLGSNYPNPFNPSTSIPFRLDQSADVSLNIFDIRGSLVARMISGHLNAGEYVSVWDGSNSQGFEVSSGIYHAVLSAHSQTTAIKITLLK